jgi:hypothetical protein
LPRLPALDVDLLELACLGLDELSGESRLAVEPVREFLGGRRAVCRQVPAEDLAERRPRIELLPAAEPLVGPNERHVAAAHRAVAEQPRLRRGADQLRPSLGALAELDHVRLPPGPPADPPRHLLAELLAGEHLPP